MKKVLLIFVLSFSLGDMMAQSEPTLTITEKTLQWDNISKQRIIEDKDNNIIYVGFKDGLEPFKLKVDIKAYEDDKTVNRKIKLNKLFFSDKPIFIKGFVGGKNKQPIYYPPHCCCGEMVDDKNGKFLTLSYIEIKQEDLPIKITHNNKEVILTNFNRTDTTSCESVRKYCLGFTSPTIIEDTLSLEDLPKLQLNAIHIQSNKSWCISENYYINGQGVSVTGSSIMIPKDLLPSIEKDRRLLITYKAKLSNEYFGHDFNYCIAKIGLVDSKAFHWEYDFAFWHIGIAIIIIAVIVFLMNRKKILEYFAKRKKNKIEIIQQAYIEEILGNDEDRLCFISNLLSNVSDDFKQRVLSVLGIEPTLPVPPCDSSINELKEQITQKDTKIQNLEAKINENDNTINKLSEKLVTAQKENKSLSDENTKLNDAVEELRLEIDSLKSLIADKDKQIEQLLQKIRTLQDQLSSISRQNMYLLQVDDVLKDISDDILVAVENVEDEDLRKKLVLPLLNGVNGLDEGLTTYYKRWQEQVMKVQKNFFGKDLYEMTDDEVKTKLVSGFLKNLAQGDTFSKLTRLYMYIQADWINEILIKNKFNVDKIEQIFNRLKMLFNDFGIEFIYPRLFVDKMNEQLYTFDPRCEVFKLFTINEEMRMLYSKQSDLIVDIIQIGVKIPSEKYSRKAIVSIPNF